MSRPHARKANSPRRRNTHHRGNGSNNSALIIAGVLIGLFILGLVLLYHHKKSPAKPDVKKVKTVLKHTHPAKESAKADKAAPQFDFYTLLPEKQIDEESNTAVATRPNAALVNKPSTSMKVHKFILQVGAFKRLEDADKVRAKLILQGFDVQITAVQVKGVTWQRITVGPYKSAAEAQQAQDKLSKANVKSLLFQLS